VPVATIGDVARAAGVSRSTVSYALSGKRTISRETRERIDAAIRGLGFTPHAGARALKTTRTMVLALLLQFHADEFAPAMLEYVLPVTDAARERGYDILLLTEEDGAAALRRVTRSGMVDGVVLLDVTHADPRLAALREAGRPGVLIGVPGDATGLDVFDLDFGEAARTIVDHLHGLGHEDLVLVVPPRRVFERGGAYAWRFRDAAVERAARYGLRVSTHHGESRQPAVARALHEILDARPEATAVVVHNDASIAALPAVLHDRGVVVPRDLSVLSLYSKHFAETFSLPYTAIETSPGTLARLALERLVRRIDLSGDAGTPVVRFVDPTLADRGSTTRR
jgi:DNA-binding LacI/PurR family transcriptional regulator